MSVVEKYKTMEYGPAPEDPKETLIWLDAHKRRFGHFIGGKWHAPSEGKYFETSDPANLGKIADVAQGSAADVDAAVSAARAALPVWQGFSSHERAKYLYALARQIQKHSRRLSVLETIDNGNQSAKAATLIFRSSPAILSSRGLGAVCLTRNFPAIPLVESWGRLFRGIFRCLCWPGKSLLHWRRGIQCLEACRVHAANRTRLCGDLR